jgi:hypothetical protein
VSAKKEALWANHIQRLCLLETDDVGDALAAAEVILSTQPVQEDDGDEGWITVPGSFLQTPHSTPLSINLPRPSDVVIHNHVAAPIAPLQPSQPIPESPDVMIHNHQHTIHNHITVPTALPTAPQVRVEPVINIPAQPPILEPDEQPRVVISADALRDEYVERFRKLMGAVQ